MPKHSKKNQKYYKMKGCSKKSRRKYLGGNMNLAYPSDNVPKVPNPFLSYTGKGGNNSAMPKTDPPPPSPALSYVNSSMRGGTCGASCGLMKGGTCCASCGLMKGGNAGIPYPDGLVGKPWTPAISSWPGVDGISGNRNYIPPNTYNEDISRQMKDLGANPPYLGGRRRKKRKNKKTKKQRQRGGNFSNFLGQDLINLGRQVQFGFGTTYNALAGYSAPVSPLPWKDQLVSSNNIRV